MSTHLFLILTLILGVALLASGLISGSPLIQGFGWGALVSGVIILALEW